MKYKIHKEEVFNCSPARLWRALTDPALLGQWLMETDFQLIKGYEFQFRMEPQKNWDGIVDCQVLDFELEKKLTYSWKGQAIEHTIVTWTLAPHDDGVKLTLDHTGFSGFKEILIGFFHTSGWNSMLRKKLPEVLKKVEAI